MVEVTTMTESDIFIFIFGFGGGFAAGLGFCGWLIGWRWTSK
jgi:hypothetical protein